MQAVEKDAQLSHWDKETLTFPQMRKGAHTMSTQHKPAKKWSQMSCKLEYSPLSRQHLAPNKSPRRYSYQATKTC